MPAHPASLGPFGGALLALFVAWGCSGRSGTNGDPGAGSGGSAGSSGDGGPAGSAGSGVPDGGLPPDSGAGFDPGPCDPSTSLAPARIWQLTDEEYASAVEKVLGVTLAPADVPS